MLAAFVKEIDALRKEFKKQLAAQRDIPAKSFETMNSIITTTDDALFKKIKDVESKVVSEAFGTAKEVLAVADR